MGLMAEVQAEHPRVTLIRLGVAAAVTQAVLLREAMAALGGSELAWGVVLALWLAGMGAGARAGVRIGSALLARALPAVMLAATAAGAVLLRAAPALVGATTGESLTTWYTIWVWSIAVLPAAVAGGLAFPVLAAVPRSGGPGVAYAWEAVGALAGGMLFTAALAPIGTAATLSICLGLVLTPWLWWHSRVLAGAVLLLALLVARPANQLLAQYGWRWSARAAPLAAWTETRHQRLELSAGEPAALYADGRLIASYPDPYVTVPRAHLLMLLHPSPQRVLIAGGTADGTLLSIVKHPLQRLRVVEDDPALIRTLPAWYGEELGAVLTDPRVELSFSDPARALGERPAWDLILLLGSSPTTIRRNRLFSQELLAVCEQRLAPGGLLVRQLAVSDTYLGGAAGRLLAVMTATLRDVFPEVVAVPGETVLLVAGRTTAAAALDSEILAQRWAERGIDDPDFIPEMLPLLVDPWRSEELNRAISEPRAPVNSQQRPRAVLLAAGLAEARGQPPLLRVVQALESRPATPLLVPLVLVMVGVLVAAGRRRSAGTATAGVVGAVSMGWWLLLLAVWQATLGSVYAEVGLLSGLFMAGLAAGALMVRRWSSPARALPALVTGGVMLSGTIAFGLPYQTPLMMTPVLLVVGGGLTGAAFAGVASLAGDGEARRGAGIGLAADEAGAAVAALVVGLLALPWAGLTATALGLAALQAATLPAAFRGRSKSIAGPTSARYGRPGDWGDSRPGRRSE
jgi:spermidine synthase